MSVTLPTGWTGFQGGGSDPDLCGEPQEPPDCPSPPCFDIPPIVIVPPGGVGSSATMACTFNGNDHTMDFTIDGGVPPFMVLTTGGAVTILGLRSFNLNIHAVTGPIAYFRPWVFTDGGIAYCIGAPCSSPNNISAATTADVRLRPFDCMGIHIPRVVNGFEDNLAPDQDAGTDLDHPIGEDPDDRTCDIEVNWGGVRDPASQPSDPDHWSPNTFDCIPAEGEAFVHVTARVAGKNGVNGTIHAAAPDFDETVPLPVGAPDCFSPRSSDGVEFTRYIDVRTQTLIDAGCCVVPGGDEITITVIGANGSVGIIVIPVVEAPGP